MKTIDVETLQLELLEAKRLIERNTLILQLNEQCVTYKAELEKLKAEKLKESK